MDLTRRNFLKQTGLGTSAAVAAGSLHSAFGGEIDLDSTDAGSPPAPHKPLHLSGLHAYAEKSVTAGETIHFRASSTIPYELSICRLGQEMDDSTSDEVLHTFPAADALSQPIHVGSYIHIDKGLPANNELSAVTLECWIRPWRLTASQGILSQHDYPNACGLGLFLGPEGQLRFYLGDGGKYQSASLHSGPVLKRRKWHHVVGVWDGKTKSLWVNGEPEGHWTFEGPLVPGSAPMRIGAYGHEQVVDRFLEGDVAMPAIYGRALTNEEIIRRFEQRGLKQAEGEDVLACWPLTEERGERVADVSTNERHGRIVNHATWMVGGPSFDSDGVPRYDPQYEPAKDANRGHGLRLCSDDLYDCDWKETHPYRLPSDARSGIYVGRYRFELDGKPYQYDVPFVVKSPAKRSKPSILVLCSTNTWQAYSSTSFAENMPPGLQPWDTTGVANSKGNPPSFSQYRVHHYGESQEGPPVYQQGLNMPWPAACPQATYVVNSSYSHLTRGERFLHVWLDQNGYDYDLVTDYDLHRNPDLLKQYEVLVINGHSEYWSAEAYDGVDRYLQGGGNVAVFSGNTMFWRVSYSEDGSIMECRKFDRDAAAREGSTLGEIWHSHDGLRGGLSCECGYPAWKVVGLEFLGWSSSDVSTFQAYQVDADDHFLFHQPEQVGLESGEFFGQSPEGPFPIALGHEWDVRLSTLARLTPKPFPKGAQMPDEPEGIVTLAHGNDAQRRSRYLDYFMRRTPNPEGYLCDMIYWDRPGGGRVFNAGAIGSGWVLSADPKFGTLIRNVLHHFGVESHLE